jgi:F0F1-type ATP synthase membrane subunit b/b'
VSFAAIILCVASQRVFVVLLVVVVYFVVDSVRKVLDTHSYKQNIQSSLKTKYSTLIV